MATKRDTTNAGIYDRIDNLRLEVKQDISVAVNTVARSQGRLEKKFDDLEAGRLTRLEGKYSDLSIELERYMGRSSANEATLSTKVALLIFLLTVVGSAIINVGINRVLK
jgi:hypothetical protein